MANTTNCVVINGTASAVASVGGSGTAAPAYSATTMTLTDAQMTAAVTDATRTTGLAFIPLSTDTEKHWIAKVLRVGRNPGV